MAGKPEQDAERRDRQAIDIAGHRERPGAAEPEEETADPEQDTADEPGEEEAKRA